MNFQVGISPEIKARKPETVAKIAVGNWLKVASEEQLRILDIEDAEKNFDF